jgi:hypothetical protein
MLLTSLIAVMGCSGFSGAVTGTADPVKLESLGESQIPKVGAGALIGDVPIPAGFMATASASRSGVDRKIRRLRHEYQGRGKVEQVAAFYHATLPTRGWREAGEQVTARRGRLVLTKGYEKLWIIINKSWKNWNKLTITVVIDNRQLLSPPESPMAVTPGITE